MRACFCVDIFSRISSVCSAFPHAHNCVFRTPNPASILSYSHTSAFPCSRIAAHHISARRWFACSCSRIPAPVSLHPCAQRPAPARSLAPMRPAPGPGPLPCTRAPGPGPFPCSHAPGARSRPGPLHPCAQRPRPRRLSSLQAGPYRRETVRKARKKAGRQTVRLFTRGCAPSVLYAKSQACASASLRP